MASSVGEFWGLVEQSRLLAPQQCQQLQREFQATNGSTDHSSPQALAEWLVSQNMFSRYQVAVLLAGHAGPFVYGDYKIYDRVESGRLAGEFRAVHASVGHPVMLRFLSGPVVQDARVWAAAATEAQIACSLSHPTLQRFFELVDLGSFKFLVEEDLHGETLAERLTVGRVPPQEACRIARMIAKGLAAIHATGRAHGDVRPINIWLELPSHQHPGLAKLLRDPLVPPGPINLAAEDPQGWLLTQTDYLAPEMQVPGKSPDVLTDLYALGCTLYHMLAGHPPFPGGSVMQKMARHAGEPIRPLESYGIPQPLAQLVVFLMAKNPSLRYQDAQTVADQLTAFLDPGTANLAPPPAQPTLPAYEAAVRQSQAALATRTVQTTFGIPAQGVAAETSPAIPAGVAVAAAAATPEVPVGSVPVGKPVGTPAAGTAVAVKSNAVPTKTLIDPNLNDPQAIAAKEAREKRKLIIILVSVGVVAILAIIGLNMLGRNSGDPTANNGGGQNTSVEEVPEIVEQIGVQSDTTDDPPVKPLPDTETVESPPEKAPETKVSSATDSGPAYEVVADDGKLPWASPTSGKPIELKYVPPGGGVFLVARPSTLLQTPEGPKVLKALGPKFESLRGQWEQASGLSLEDCDQVIVTLHDNDNQFPKVSVVARSREPLSREALSSKWSGATEQKEGSTTYYSGPAWSYYLPADDGHVLVMAPAEEIKLIIEQPLPLLSLEMEQMRRASDDQRHLTVLFSPASFLFIGQADPLFTGDLARAKDPLKWLLGENIQAALFSAHLADSLYVEMREQTKVDKRPDQLASELRDRLAEVPVSLKDYFVSQLDPPMYWKGFSFDFPAMIRALHEQSRVGSEGKQAVINAVLPAVAGHNLVLGTELTLATAPGQASTTTVVASGPKTIEDVMNLKIKNYSFDQKTFEEAVKEIENEAKEQMKGASVDFGMVIMGPELETDGITRNRSIGSFSQSDKTVAEVLTALCLKNNPIPTVKEPNELDQKLIWVIADDPETKKRRVLVTTRAAADKNGFKLPAVFQLK